MPWVDQELLNHPVHLWSLPVVSGLHIVQCVQSHVFTFLVLYSCIRYDLNVETVFVTSLLMFVCLFVCLFFVVVFYGFFLGDGGVVFLTTTYRTCLAWHWHYVTVYQDMMVTVKVRFIFKSMVLNVTVNNILLVEETGVPGGNQRPVASYWQTLFHERSRSSQLYWW